MRDLTPALDLLDLAVASSTGLSSEEHREAAASLAKTARRRRTFLSGTVVVAIAGGTGTGKSSLVNAIAGQTVASTSPLRPHTDVPLAWIPGDDDAIAAMIESLGIATVVEHDEDRGLALIDLPDLDSVDGRHRELVEQVLPLADAVIWVFDPVKYHDPSIHSDFLADMTAYEPVCTFVLNKIDRLDEAEVEAVTAHLTGILRMDGFVDPVVEAVAAAPPHAAPIGIDDLGSSIERTLVAKHADRIKLVEDVVGAGRRLATDASLWTGTGNDAYDEIRDAADDPERLLEVLDGFGIGDPLRSEIVASGGHADVLDSILTRRSELAATVAALGVTCAELSGDGWGAS